MCAERHIRISDGGTSIALLALPAVCTNKPRCVRGLLREDETLKSTHQEDVGPRVRVFHSLSAYVYGHKLPSIVSEMLYAALHGFRDCVAKHVSLQAYRRAQTFGCLS